MQRTKNDSRPTSSKDLRKKRPKKTAVDTIREEFGKTGDFEEPDAKAGINGISTTAFLSSSLLVDIGFCLKDGFFQKFDLSTLFQGLIFFFLQFLMTLLLIVCGVVIFQTVKDSKASKRNLTIYWCVLIAAVTVLIVLL